EQDLMLENARAEFRDEAQEIATYRTIGSLANAVGDSETARLAREILREEERMASYLGDLIPELAFDVAHDEVPVSEIEGPAAHRTSANGARRRSPRGGARARPAARGRTATRARARARAVRRGTGRATSARA